ncbi:MAG: adenylate cyclase, partial [Candidatus Azotimanducaceae bacterium]
YGVAAWAASEVAINVEEPLQLPGWLDTAVIIVLALGFPIALILAYAYNLTPEGIKPDSGEESSTTTDRNDKNTSLIFSSIVLAAIGFGAWQYFVADEVLEIGATAHASVEAITDVTQPVPGFQGRKAIAVLPFVNMSGDPDQGYLADGISEDIITELYAFKTFPVIARTSTFRYKGQNKDVRDIAAELGAGYVLEGSVRRIGERVRVTAQLIDAQGGHLWAENFDRLWVNFLDVHDEITYSIVEAIEPQLIRSESRRRRDIGTADMEAWDYYLRARSLTSEEFSYMTLSGVPVSKQTSDEAWRLANLALEKATDFAAAYSLLSHIDGTRVLFLSEGMRPDEVSRLIERGLRNAARARSLDAFEATACACQIVLLLLKQDVTGAVEVGESALVQNPGSAFILAGLAKALQIAGDYERALSLIEKAKRLSPKGISMATYLGFEALILQSMGDMEGARRVARQSTMLVGPVSMDIVVRMTSYLADGDREQALREMRALRDLNPQYDPMRGGWPEPFPQAVAESVEPELGKRLQGASYAEGIAIVLEELGWSGFAG